MQDTRRDPNKKMETAIPDFRHVAMYALAEAQSAKREAGRSPDLVTLADMAEVVKAGMLEALRGMYSDGLIEHRRTLNGVSLFGIKTTELNGETS